MWSRLLIPFSLIFTIYGQAAALPSGRNESLLDRRVDVLQQTVIKPWPKENDDDDDETALHPIPYCFQDYSKDRKIDVDMKWSVNGAIARWQDNGYIRRGEFVFPVKFKKLNSCPTEGGDFLTVRITEGKEVFTTLGYNGREHTMGIGKKYLSSKEITGGERDRRFGREIGRSMGLLGPFELHPDAFVIKCENLHGYKDIVKQLGKSRKIKEKEAERIAKQACGDLALATELGWEEAKQFAKYDPTQLQQQMHPLDMASIMNLEQKAYGGKGKKVLFRKIRNQNGEIKEEDYSLVGITGPSREDLAALTEFYGYPPPYRRTQPLHESRPPPPPYSQS